MGIIAHQQLKKTGLSEGKQMINQLENKNGELISYIDDQNEKVDQLEKENKKLKAALKKLEKENDKLKNPVVWMNEGEL